MSAGGNLVRAYIHLSRHLGDIPDHVRQVGVNGVQAHRKGLEIPNVIALIFGHVHREVSVCNLPQNAPYIVDGFL